MEKTAGTCTIVDEVAAGERLLADLQRIQRSVGGNQDERRRLAAPIRIVENPWAGCFWLNEAAVERFHEFTSALK